MSTTWRMASSGGPDGAGGCGLRPGSETRSGTAIGGVVGSEGLKAGVFISLPVYPRICIALYYAPIAYEPMKLVLFESARLALYSSLFLYVYNNSTANTIEIREEIVQRPLTKMNGPLIPTVKARY